MAFDYNDNIPTLDLSDFTNGSTDQKQQFVADLGEIYSEIGFVAITNHGYTSDRQTNLYNAVQQFFELPDATKLEYDGSFCGGQRGYTGKGKEHAAGRSTGDLKEFFHVGKHLPLNKSAHYQKNIFPKEIPAFEEETSYCYKKLEHIGGEILSAISLYLGLSANHFVNKVDKGISILRPIHYFPILDLKNVPDDAVRAAEHGDINLITLLMGASADGLQVQRRDGRWISVTSAKDSLVVNVGDMLERYTNGKLKSTIHRVVNPPKEKLGTSRYSIPFFMHANPTMPLNCLKECISEETPKKYEDITAEEFLMERLRAIGLIK